MKKGFWTVVDDIVRKADIILEVLDARMPDLTRNDKIEAKIKEYGRKMIFLINKSDIVSKTTIKNIEEHYKDQNYVITSSKRSDWIHILLKKIKTIVKKDKIKVAFIGYPNTGKSSLINKLSKRGRARTSSESGFTKGHQLIAGRSGLMFVDTPGVVPFEARDEIRLGLISGISPEKLQDPEGVVCELISIFKNNDPSVFSEYYNVDINQDEDEIMEQIGKNKGMLKKGGIVDEKRVARQILNDWHNGKIKI